jgi:hypothetical protein
VKGGPNLANPRATLLIAVRSHHCNQTELKRISLNRDLIGKTNHKRPQALIKVWSRATAPLQVGSTCKIDRL